MRPFLRALCVLPLLLTAACVISIGGESSWFGASWSDLDHEHVETLPLSPEEARVAVRTGSGSVLAEPAGGNPRIVATIREEEPDDGYLVFEEGELRVRSRSGRDVALGKVEVYLDGTTGELDLSTGSGRIRLRDVPVREQVTLSTGSGDIDARGLGSPRLVSMGTGSGEIDVAGVDCQQLHLGTGSGDITVTDVRSEHGDFDTGSGDVRARRSSFQRLRADSGSGDLDLRGSEVRSTSFRTGSGRVLLDDR